MNVIEIIMKAQDQASKVMNNVESRSGQLKNSILSHNRAIGTALAGMGTAIAGAAILSVKNYAAMGDEIAKMAKRTGFSTEALSELKHVMELSGANFTDIEKSSRKLSGAFVDANEGMATYQRAFERIGVDYIALRKATPERQFIAVAEALSKVEDETIRVATANDIFGRTGTSLLPMFEDGIDGLNRMRQEAHDLGIVFDEDAAKKAEEMTDAMLRMERSVQAISLTFAETLVPVLLPLAETFADIMKPINKFLEAHPLLQKAVAALTVGFATLAIPMGILLALAPRVALQLAVMGGKALISAAAFLIKAVASVWAWAGAIPFVGIGLGIAGVAAIMASVMAARSKAGQLKSFQYGGIVPGLPGQPVPIMAHGGERYLGVGASSMPGGSLIVNFYGPLLGNQAEASQFADWLDEAYRRKQRYVLGKAQY